MICTYGFLYNLFIWPSVTTSSVSSTVMKQMTSQYFHVSKCNCIIHISLFISSCDISLIPPPIQPDPPRPRTVSAHKRSSNWKRMVACTHLSAMMNAPRSYLVSTPLFSAGSLPASSASQVSSAGKLTENQIQFPLLLAQHRLSKLGFLPAWMIFSSDIYCMTLRSQVLC